MRMYRGNCKDPYLVSLDMSKRLGVSSKCKFLSRLSLKFPLRKHLNDLIQELIQVYRDLKKIENQLIIVIYGLV